MSGSKERWVTRRGNVLQLYPLTFAISFLSVKATCFEGGRGRYLIMCTVKCIRVNMTGEHFVCVCGGSVGRS